MNWKELLVALLLGLLSDELLGWSRSLSRWLVRKAAARLPIEHSGRYEAEWLETLESRPALSRLLFAIDLHRAAFAMMQDLHPRPYKLSTDIAVRANDFLGAALMLVFISPLFLLALLLLKWENGNDARPLRRIECVGRNGKRIELYRFWILRGSDGDLRPIGRFLLVTSLVELPQLLNVLKGDLGLVGPRADSPELHVIRTAQNPAYAQRLLLRPGLTGPQQLDWTLRRDRGEFGHILEHDRELLANYGLVSRLRYLWKTMLVVVTGRAPRPPAGSPPRL